MFKSRKIKKANGHRKLDLSNFEVRSEPLPYEGGVPIIIPTYLDDEMVAYMFVTVNENSEATIFHMHTEPALRCNGIGEHMIEDAQKRFSKISTEVTGNSEKLLRRNGFEWENVDGIDMLVWEM